MEPSDYMKNSLHHKSFIKKVVNVIEVPNNYICGCGSEIKNNKYSINTHNKTKKHMNFEQQGKCLHCDCGIGRKNYDEREIYHNYDDEFCRNSSKTEDELILEEITNYCKDCNNYLIGQPVYSNTIYGDCPFCGIKNCYCGSGY